MLLIAQSTQEAAKGIYLWLGVIVLAAILLGIIALVLRKLLIQEDESPGQVGFTLSDLRDLHANGELSDEQFEQAKRQMLARGRAMLAEDPEDADPRGGMSGNPVEEIDLG